MAAKAKKLVRKLPPPVKVAPVVAPAPKAKAVAKAPDSVVKKEKYVVTLHADQLDPYTMPNRTGLLEK